MSSVRITQVRSTIGQTKAHEGTLRSLGLGRIGRSAEHAVSPALEGKLRHVAHLVRVESKGAK
jgi:large subunit ribosomal protein L30